jgi:hypothetical protein
VNVWVVVVAILTAVPTIVVAITSFIWGRDRIALLQQRAKSAQDDKRDQMETFRDQLRVAREDRDREVRSLERQRDAEVSQLRDQIEFLKLTTLSPSGVVEELKASRDLYERAVARVKQLETELESALRITGTDDRREKLEEELEETREAVKELLARLEGATKAAQGAAALVQPLSHRSRAVVEDVLRQPGMEASRIRMERSLLFRNLFGGDVDIGRSTRAKSSEGPELGRQSIRGTDRIRRDIAEPTWPPELGRRDVPPPERGRRDFPGTGGWH